MYSFEEMQGTNSLAYWIGTLRGSLPDRYSTAEKLGSAMSFHHEVEEQAGSVESLRTTVPALLQDIFQPIAPVTLAEKWSPFPLAVKMLRQPILHGIEPETAYKRAAFGVFKPGLGSEVDESAEPNRHEKHGIFLIRLAAARAQQQKRNLMIVAKPGWSYESAAKFGFMNPEVAIFMHDAGYIYTERIAHE